MSGEEKDEAHASSESQFLKGDFYSTKFIGKMKEAAQERIEEIKVELSQLGVES